jgi:hypothetical protein
MLGRRFLAVTHSLPDHERKVFDLVRSQGLSKPRRAKWNQP